ncbi:unnamed protein product [Effrenium voratum]|nr:unnamed protein product [Effrenium voratum]
MRIFLAVRLAAAIDPVVVSLFGESGCPDTTAFIFGPLQAAEKALGTGSDVFRLEWTPFGNAYYITKECGGVPAPPGCSSSSTCRYSSQVRDCYFKRCGLGGAGAPDCYSPGPLHCQHGAAECFANRLEACATVKEPSSSWMVSRCIEEAFYKGELRNGQSSDHVTAVAVRCGFSASLQQWCTSNGDGALAAMAKMTPPHPGVPYVLVNGEVLADLNSLLEKICEAYEGPAPAGCMGLEV